MISTLPITQSRAALLGYLSTEDEELPGDQLKWQFMETLDAIHSIIMDYQRIYAKKIAETLAISKRVGYIIH
jgi:hypothetical protein